jgi:heterodisulfide reductase subunit A
MADQTTDVLVIGAGLAGIEASLVLANAGRKVYLVERQAYFGGNVIKSEEVFPNLECATCMIAPKQSDVIENPNIELLTLTEVKDVRGEAGAFDVTLLRRARYVSLENCIGCAACFEPCPVTAANDFEEGLSQRKAIYVVCAGALPNAPAIAMDECLRSKGEECTACRDACMFDAINYEDKDEERAVKVGAIVVATGYRLSDAGLPDRLENVYNAFEFERLRASNGPTEGEIRTRDGKKPKSVALLHCAGRREKGYCSQVCCRYLAKFARYAFNKLEGVEVHEFIQEVSVPGKDSQRFLETALEKGVKLVRTAATPKVSANGSGVRVEFQANGQSGSVEVDMAVLAPAIEPDSGAAALAELLGIETDSFGFFRTAGREPAAATRPGVFIAGCNSGPKDMQTVVIQAEATAAGVLKMNHGDKAGADRLTGSQDG